MEWCSGCGQSLVGNETRCPKCGRHLISAKTAADRMLRSMGVDPDDKSRHEITPRAWFHLILALIASCVYGGFFIDLGKPVAWILGIAVCALIFFYHVKAPGQNRRWPGLVDWGFAVGLVVIGIGLGVWWSYYAPDSIVIWRLQHRDVTIRRSAASLLGERPDGDIERIIPALEKALQDEDAHVCSRAKRSLSVLRWHQRQQ